MFDAYISLGDNCEPDLQFCRIGYEESSVFRFASIDPEYTLNLIRTDFAGLFRKENIIPVQDGMVRDTATGIAVHSKMTSHMTENGVRVFTDGLDMGAIYLTEKEKMDHLVGKWRRMVSSSRRVLYFFKRNFHGSRADAEVFHRVFSECYPRHDWTILYIQSEEHREPPWGMDRLHNEYVSHLAPYDNAHASDAAGWDRIFAKYPLAAPARSAEETPPTGMFRLAWQRIFGRR